MITNLNRLLIITDEYINYLTNKIDFSKEGLPIFKKEMFLDKRPDLIVTYPYRNNKIVSDPQKTVISFFDSDADLYIRLEKVFKDINEYKRYMGVIGLDITVTNDMDIEWQNMIMLINQLFLAILACNGIKIIMNARIGSPITINNLNSIPKDVIWATSFLGCKNLDLESDFSFISKIIQLVPSELLIYGKHDKIAENQLSNMGITYHVYTDMHRLTKKGGRHNG